MTSAAQEEQASPSPASPPPVASFRGHFRQRMHPWTSAVVALPLVLFYQIGILASPGRNGADVLTDRLIQWCQHSMETYVAVMSGVLVLYLLLLLRGGKNQRLVPQAVFPTVLESLIYAMSMGSLILLLMQELGNAVPGLALAQGQTLFDVLVISAGAGIHEELVFRVLGCGVLARLLALYIHRFGAWTIAVLLSSVAFSLAHHVGPNGEAFTTVAFLYRFLAGLYFAVIYRLRGAGVAMWTHTLYDVYVLALS